MDFASIQTFQVRPLMYSKEENWVRAEERGLRPSSDRLFSFLRKRKIWSLHVARSSVEMAMKFTIKRDPRAEICFTRSCRSSVRSPY